MPIPGHGQPRVPGLRRLPMEVSPSEFRLPDEVSLQILRNRKGHFTTSSGVAGLRPAATGVGPVADISAYRLPRPSGWLWFRFGLVRKIGGETASRRNSAGPHGPREAGHGKLTPCPHGLHPLDLTVLRHRPPLPPLPIPPQPLPRLSLLKGRVILAFSSPKSE